MTIVLCWRRQWLDIGLCQEFKSQWKSFFIRQRTSSKLVHWEISPQFLSCSCSRPLFGHFNISLFWPESIIPLIRSYEFWSTLDCHGHKSEIKTVLATTVLHRIYSKKSPRSEFEYSWRLAAKYEYIEVQVKLRIVFQGFEPNLFRWEQFWQHW